MKNKIISPMKIIEQFSLCLVTEYLFSTAGFILGAAWGGDFYFPIGNAEGWEGFGVILGISGVCFGGLIGMLIINRLFNDKVKNIYLLVLALALIVLWLSTYGFLPMSLIHLSSATSFTLLNNFPFVKKLD